MTLRQKSLVSTLILLAGLICFLVGVSSRSPVWRAVMLAGCGVMGGGVYLKGRWARCPYCGAYLGRHWVKFCPDCGKRIDYDAKKS